MMNAMERQQDYALRTVEERGVRLIRLWFTDVLGQLKSVAISPAELEVAFEEGVHFDGSAIDGFSRVQESDVIARPDPTTFELLPWSRDGDVSARMFCDILSPDGTPFDGDPRQVLKRNLDRAREAGFQFMVAPEMEFFYFAHGDPSRPLEPLDTGSYFDLTTTDAASDLRKRTITMLEALGIPVEYSFHEDAPSQHEIDLRYTDALTMADNVMTFRLVVREIALERGNYATFMPKPLEGVQGSGMHTHLSLFSGDGNAFHDGDDPYGLSSVARGFIAGLLHHAPEITAVTNQLVNFYKRLVHGYEAPTYVTWARNNRSALVRVPMTKPGKESSTRIEFRSPDPACNPYLAFSVMLAAGLRGIERGYDLPDESDGNVFELSATERAVAGIGSLPQSLADALDRMEASELVADALGDHIFEWFLRNKRDEWQAYKSHVTPFELARYLPSV
jgi:glutamine synthetase